MIDCGGDVIVLELLMIFVDLYSTVTQFQRNTPHHTLDFSDLRIFSKKIKKLYAGGFSLFL